jgi:hypothetical protein
MERIEVRLISRPRSGDPISADSEHKMHQRRVSDRPPSGRLGPSPVRGPRLHEEHRPHEEHRGVVRLLCQQDVRLHPGRDARGFRPQDGDCHRVVRGDVGLHQGHQDHQGSRRRPGNRCHHASSGDGVAASLPSRDATEPSRAATVGTRASVDRSDSPRLVPRNRDRPAAWDRRAFPDRRKRHRGPCPETALATTVAGDDSHRADHAVLPLGGLA